MVLWGAAVEAVNVGDAATAFTAVIDSAVRF
jgi:hypothetical protein